MAGFPPVGDGVLVSRRSVFGVEQPVPGPSPGDVVVVARADGIGTGLDVACVESEGRFLRVALGSVGKSRCIVKSIPPESCAAAAGEGGITWSIRTLRVDSLDLRGGGMEGD